MSTTSTWYDQVEVYQGVSTDNAAAILNKSQAISLKRIADALEIIAAKPAIDNDAIYRAISEAGFAVLQHMRNG
jgi:hypothetical protein